MHIEITKMLFGDYNVDVWGEDLNSRLDRQYFCRGYPSALLTALHIREMDMFKNLDIYYREMDELTKIKL